MTYVQQERFQDNQVDHRFYSQIIQDLKPSQDHRRGSEMSHVSQSQSIDLHLWSKKKNLDQTSIHIEELLNQKMRETYFMFYIHSCSNKNQFFDHSFPPFIFTRTNACQYVIHNEN